MDKYEKFEKDFVRVIKKIKAFLDYVAEDFEDWKEEIAHNIEVIKSKIKVRKWLYSLLLFIHKVVIGIILLSIAGLTSYSMFILTLAYPILMLIYFYILLMAVIIFRFIYGKVL